MAQMPEPLMELPFMFRASKYAKDDRINRRRRFQLGKAVNEVLRLADLNEVGARVLNHIRN